MSSTLTPAAETGVDKGLPDAAYMVAGASFHGLFRYPHGRWSLLVDKAGAPLSYGDAVSATRAALAFVMGQLFRPIRVDRASDLQSMAEALGVDRWKADKASRSIETRKIHRGDGKAPVLEERRRSKRGRRA